MKNIIIFLCSSMLLPSHAFYLEMKRGRGSFGKEIGGAGIPSSSTGSSINWIPLPTTSNKIMSQEGKVVLLDTNIPTLVDKNVNPTGAVSVLNYKDQTYCFAASCPSCKIPLTKAKLFDGNEESKNAPRLSCDFCKATFSLKNGQRLAPAEKPGLIGGIVKNIFATQASGPLPLYKLGEKEGKLFIALD